MTTITVESVDSQQYVINSSSMSQEPQNPVYEGVTKKEFCEEFNISSSKFDRIRKLIVSVLPREFAHQKRQQRFSRNQERMLAYVARLKEQRWQESQIKQKLRRDGVPDEFEPYPVGGDNRN